MTPVDWFLLLFGLPVIVATILTVKDYLDDKGN